jgi:hypothetical protein
MREAHAGTGYDERVLCPEGPAPSEAEFVLLSYLGREFVDGAPWDAQNHWQRAYKNGSFAIVEDFVTSDVGDGKRVKIHEKKKSEVHSVGFGSQTDEVDIMYDRSMAVPDTIHDDAVSATGDSTGHATFDFQLNKDSLAKQ